MTALAISKLALLIRARISTHTPAHASGPAFLHWSSARPTAANSPSMSGFGYVIPSAMPYGETSPPTSPTVAGCVSGKRLPSSASNAARPASAAPSP